MTITRGTDRVFFISFRKKRLAAASWTHRRETLPVTYRAIAGLVSDRNTTG